MRNWPEVKRSPPTSSPRPFAPVAPRPREPAAAGRSVHASHHSDRPPSAGRTFARGRRGCRVRVHDRDLGQEPYRVGKRLLPPLADRFTARRGTYRIIYRVDDHNRTVTVVDIDHRRDVYRS
ncbi:type II toxin-antitoxin system RelE family toxin [Micromonospora inyonensis]|uniref:type II toxin-antitoxin system RelE family toxin n=1 Tax=Micromonospora inyonensis TaxID=47866 RepID=UPI001FDF709D|nr:type II toxin-antitoxin system RelE/ParE family toxin [Micromonospora inyonensis]